MFHNSDDESWANRLIVIFARILTYVFRDDGEQMSLREWMELESLVEQWEVSRPWNFTPLFAESPRVSALQPNSSWPELYVCNPAQVMGLQHYHLANFTLAIYNPRVAMLSIGSLRLRRDSKVCLPTYLQ